MEMCIICREGLLFPFVVAGFLKTNHFATDHIRVYLNMKRLHLIYRRRNRYDSGKNFLTSNYIGFSIDIAQYLNAMSAKKTQRVQGAFRDFFAVLCV